MIGLARMTRPNRRSPGRTIEMPACASPPSLSLKYAVWVGPGEPSAIVQASYAAGYFEAVNSGALTTNSSLDPQVKRKKERVEGVVEEETEYFAATGATDETGAVVVPMVEALLKPFLGCPDFPDALVV